MIILFPTQEESAKFRVACPTAQVVICGVGMVETAATMARIAAQIVAQECPKQVILAGIAGAYDTDEFAIGSVVEVIEEQVEELPQKYRKKYAIAPRFGLPRATSNCVSKPYFEGEGGSESQIENMEGAAAAAICEAMGVEFSELRAISNRVADERAKWEIGAAIDALTDALTTIYNKNNK